MDAAAVTQSAWSKVATDTVGELLELSGSAAAAVVLPGPALQLPPQTVRNQRSIALLRLRRGPLWMLSVVGHRWTTDRLALVADLLKPCGDVGPDAVLINRVGDQLGSPNVQIVLPTVADLEGASWNVRPLAVALVLARGFAGGSTARGAMTSAEVEALATEIRSSLKDALERYRCNLDGAALIRCQGYGDSALRVYNYLVSDPHRRNRIQFGDVLPVFLQAVASSNDQSPYGEVRQAIDVGRPLAALVGQTVGVGPAVFRSLVGVKVDVCGARWLESPTALMRLIGAIRPDRRPGHDPAAWAALNRLVEHVENVVGCSVQQSLVGQMWVRDALNARPGTRDRELAPDADTRAWGLVETFREDLYAAIGALQIVRVKVGKSSGHDGLRQVIDHWLLHRTRKQLRTLAERWHDVYAAEKVGDASLIACMHGERYWGFLPSPLTVADGRRSVVSLVSRQQLVDFGTAMVNCLEASYLQSYDAACRSGGTFLVGLVDGETGAPCSTAEFKVGRLREGARISVELVQHMARRNAAPSQACVVAMRELLQHVEGDAVQRHLRLGVTAVRAIRKQGALAVSAKEQETRLRALRLVLGDPSFETLCKLCEQARK